MMLNSASCKIWQKQKLGCLFSFHRSLSASRAQLGEIGIPYLHYGDIHKTGKTSFDPEKDELPKLDYRENAEKYLLKNGDVVFVDASEDRKDASRFCVIKNKNNVPFLAGLHTVVARPKSDELNINFSEFLFQSNDFRKQVSILANGMKVFGISKDILSNIVIRYPRNTAEQKKIAEILGTWDSAIEKLTALIAAKRLQKKGLIYSYVKKAKDTETFMVSDLFDLGRGKVISKNEIEKKSGIYPVFSSQTSNDGILGYINSFDYDGEFITWTTDGANAGRVFFRKGKFNCTNVCGLASLKKDINLNLYYAMTYLNLVTKYYVSYVGNPKLMNNAFASIPIQLPSINYQNKVSDILSKADEEIDLLTRKLDLIQSQKKGLMQQLLTGKIRVKVA